MMSLLSIDQPCIKCGGYVRHNPWCETENIRTQEAIAIAEGRKPLSMQDILILRALGVKW